MKKSIFLALAVAAGLFGAAYAKVSVQKESCSGDTTRCITKGNGDVVWGEYTSDEEGDPMED